ncbi:MAG: hypothetical protein NWE95_07870 [Candidatus Bathyarchaeota archaeon]|nr:hypothetical protein [Candidatus Bathyarchaeota archaeon]
MKRTLLLAVVVVVLVLTVLTAVFIVSHAPPTHAVIDDGKFYVGVTYCGNTTAEAKQLIDKVKNYTNLFILQSGTLQNDTAAIYEIGDYAVESGLDFITFFGGNSGGWMLSWLSSYDERWGEHFLGVYFADERGGKMLDNEMRFYDSQTKSSFLKIADGSILDYMIDKNTNVTYKGDGTIVARSGYPTVYSENYNITTYYSNGTITFLTHQEAGSGSSKIVEDASSLPYTYEELWSARPIKSYDEAAERFIDSLDEMYRVVPNNQTVKTFTSDYVLYWFDYLSSYDVVLAQLGWNHSVTKDIALVRGAADMQGKTWGVIITWKYTQAPYLASGQEIYEQMRMAYRSGAKYVAIFNYAEDMQGFEGTLQEEHFQALERFWNEDVQNPNVTRGEAKAEAAFVLPKNYGWGMRKPDDTVWGLWQPPEEYRHLWTKIEEALATYGERLDIIYDDSAYPIGDRYKQVYYWNQTN